MEYSTVLRLWKRTLHGSCRWLPSDFSRIAWHARHLLSASLSKEAINSLSILTCDLTWAIGLFLAPATSRHFSLFYFNARLSPLWLLSMPRVLFDKCSLRSLQGWLPLSLKSWFRITSSEVVQSMSPLLVTCQQVCFASFMVPSCTVSFEVSWVCHLSSPQTARVWSDNGAYDCRGRRQRWERWGKVWRMLSCWMMGSACLAQAGKSIHKRRPAVL